MFRLFRKEEKPFFDDFKGFKQYTDEDFFNNRILTEEVMLSLDSSKTGKNNNVFLLSDAKDRTNYIKANILQLNSNYVIPDIGGELYNDMHYFLENNGYEVYVLNLKRMSESIHYNPLMNLIKRKEGFHESAELLVDTFLHDMRYEDEFYHNCEKSLLMALILYVKEIMPREKQNFSTVIELLELINFEKENILEDLDVLFKDGKFKTEHPKKYYEIFKQVPDKSMRGFIISLSIRLQIFRLKDVKELTEANTINFMKFGTGKKALFIITPNVDTSFNSIADMLYMQLIENLYFEAELYESSNRPIMCVVRDYFPNLSQKLQTSPKYNIHWSVISHSLAELKNDYKEEWEIIIQNCDSFLYTSGGYTELQYLKHRLGEMPIRANKQNKNNGKDLLISADELPKIDKCVLIIRGFKPMYCIKYNIEKHPNYENIKP